MLLSRDICVYRALLLLAAFNYSQLCFVVFEGERKKASRVVTTHQPSTVNTQKGGLGASLLLLHGSPAAQGAQEWHKNGLCCHKALFARATQGGSVTRHGGMFVFVALDFQNPRACCGWQAPLSLQLLEVCTPAWKTRAQHSKNVHHSCAIRQCLGELQRRGGRGDNSAALICIISIFFARVTFTFKI